ncbi:MAG: IS66 family transposase, partial [Bradymonadaceae bacterium]
LLEPIVDAQFSNILLSRILALDETHIAAGRKEKGKMNKAWFWPLYGEQDEMLWQDFEASVLQRLLLEQVGLEKKEIFDDEQGHSLLGIGVCHLSEYGRIVDAKGGEAITSIEAVERIARHVEALVDDFSVVRR